MKKNKKHEIRSDVERTEEGAKDYQEQESSKGLTPPRQEGSQQSHFHDRKEKKRGEAGKADEKIPFRAMGKVNPGPSKEGKMKMKKKMKEDKKKLRSQLSKMTG